MRELVFLLEEPSAKALLQSLLPRMLNPDIEVRLIPFEGKQDLEKQLTKRLLGYLNPNARFVVMRDQDSHPDCRVVKHGLLDRCHAAGRAHQCRVRVACRELEAFYLGDLAAVGVALGLPKLVREQAKRKFTNPDQIQNPSRELAALTQGRYQKVGSSRQIGAHLDLESRRSSSFRQLLAAIRSLEAELMALPGLPHP